MIRACAETLKKVATQLNSAITKTERETNWGFRLEEDANLPTGHVVFGPEQVTIKWDGN